MCRDAQQLDVNAAKAARLAEAAKAGAPITEEAAELEVSTRPGR